MKVLFGLLLALVLSVPGGEALAHLEELLGLPVKIASDPDPRSGAMTIRYRTLDQLDLICQRLTAGGI